MRRRTALGLSLGLAAAALAGGAFAQSQARWDLVELRSADLAAAPGQYEFLSASSTLAPSLSLYIVSYWRTRADGAMHRCLDIADGSGDGATGMSRCWQARR